jgi:hypothetical protein
VPKALANSDSDVLNPVRTWVLVQVEVEVVRPRPDPISIVIPSDPRWCRIKPTELGRRRCKLHQLSEKLGDWFGGNAVRWFTRWRDVRLGRRNTRSERSRSGKHLRTGEPAGMKQTLDGGDRLEPRRRWSDLDDDRPAVREDQRNNFGEVGPSEELFKRTGAEAAGAPLGDLIRHGPIFAAAQRTQNRAPDIPMSRSSPYKRRRVGRVPSIT